MDKGYILEFKRQGIVSTILGGLLKLFERKWNGWGWHLAVIWERTYDGWYVLEARHEVEINCYTDKWLRANTRNYKWLDSPPENEKFNKFLEDHTGKSYDVAIYFWTALQYLIRHFFNHKIPRLLDDRFTCWELVFEFCEEMGKPIGSKYDCPIITDFLRVVEKWE